MTAPYTGGDQKKKPKARLDTAALKKRIKADSAEIVNKTDQAVKFGLAATNKKNDPMLKLSDDAFADAQRATGSWEARRDSLEAARPKPKFANEDELEASLPKADPKYLARQQERMKATGGGSGDIDLRKKKFAGKPKGSK
jgi:hypothetical protein